VGEVPPPLSIFVQSTLFRYLSLCLEALTSVLLGRKLSGVVFFEGLFCQVSVLALDEVGGEGFERIGGVTEWD
jgi:hypothetical protein